MPTSIVILSTKSVLRSSLLQENFFKSPCKITRGVCHLPPFQILTRGYF